MASWKKFKDSKNGWEVERIQSRTNLNGGELERSSRINGRMRKSNPGPT